jgi:hypothetical protein
VNCKNCGNEIVKATNGEYVHKCDFGDGFGANYCDFKVAEPEETEAQRDLLKLKADAAVFGQEGATLYGYPVAEIYRTVIRLAEKVGLP